MTAVTSKMNRMVLLYMLALSMVSLPTSLARHLLVETSGNQRGDDYTDFKPKPEPGPPPISPDYSKETKPFPTIEKWYKRDGKWIKEGELFMIPRSFIPIFRHSRQSRHFKTLF